MAVVLTLMHFAQVHAMSYAGGVRRRNFAGASPSSSRAGPPAILEGTRNEVGDGQTKRIGAIAFDLIATSSRDHYLT